MPRVSNDDAQGAPGTRPAPGSRSRVIEAMRTELDRLHGAQRRLLADGPYLARFGPHIDRLSALLERVEAGERVRLQRYGDGHLRELWGDDRQARAGVLDGDSFTVESADPGA